MITHITVRRFKSLEYASFDIQSPVLLVGPNNSGKTTALQALSLWRYGLMYWLDKRKGKTVRTGVAINRKDLLNIPTVEAKNMWSSQQVQDKDSKRLPIEVIIHGIYENREYSIGLEFDHANSETIYVRPIYESDELRTKIENGDFDRASKEKIVFMQPMSGLSADEDYLSMMGSIDEKIGQGRTAEVLRNICYKLSKENPEGWDWVCKEMKEMFGIVLSSPDLNGQRGKIHLEYSIDSTKSLDITATGRGSLQVLLLLSYLKLNTGAIILLDEPDAHLEVLRQRQVYNLLVDAISHDHGQLIIASHSEIILNEAAEKDTVIGFITGHQPQQINKDALMKSLKEIGWEIYMNTKLSGHILFLEGATDLQMLQEFANKYNHPVAEMLGRANVYYTNNNLPNDAKKIFYALKAGYPSLRGYALFDRVEGKEDSIENNLEVYHWKRREFENYFSYPETIIDYVGSLTSGLFVETFRSTMREVVDSETIPAAKDDREHEYWMNTKISDDYLPGIFQKFVKKINEEGHEIENFNKGHYYKLIPAFSGDIPSEIRDVLDNISKILNK